MSIIIINFLEVGRKNFSTNFYSEIFRKAHFHKFVTLKPQRSHCYSKSYTILLVHALFCDVNYSKYKFAKRPYFDEGWHCPVYATMTLICNLDICNLHISKGMVTLALMKITHGPFLLGLYNNLSNSLNSPNYTILHGWSKVWLPLMTFKNIMYTCHTILLGRVILFQLWIVVELEKCEICCSMPNRSDLSMIFITTSVTIFLESWRL